MKLHITCLASLLVLLTLPIFPVFAEGEPEHSPNVSECDSLAEYPKLLEEATDNTWLSSLEQVKKKLRELTGNLPPEKELPRYKNRIKQYKADIKKLEKVSLYPDWEKWRDKVKQKLQDCKKYWYGRQRLSLYSASYALLIGESKYTNGWNNLENIPNELDKVEEVLKEQGFNVEKSLNLNADELKSRFEKFISDYGFYKNYRLLFFYSGHGYTFEEKTEGYIVPTDAPNPELDEMGFLRKAVEMNQILAWARRIRAKHVLFLFDSGFSGTVFKAMKSQISQVAKGPMRQFITAGSADEAVPAKSVFTPVFIDALRYGWGDGNNDGYVTGQELGEYLQKKVPEYSNQTPQYGKIGDNDLSDGDFSFFAGGDNFVGGDNQVVTQPVTLPCFNIVKENKTIKISSLANKIYGDKAFTVSTIVSSGLPVSAHATGNCTLKGNQVTLTGAGSCKITLLSQKGNANYNAVEVSQSFKIAKAAQNISFDALDDKNYGDKPFTVSAKASSGLPVSGSATGNCTLKGNQVTLTGVGDCQLTASQKGNANYHAAKAVSQSLKITKQRTPEKSVNH